MHDIPLVDAHMHLWDLAALRYPWLQPPFSDTGPAGSVAAIAKTYCLDDYRADMARWNLRGIVHVEAGAAPGDALAETRALQAMADADGQPDAIVVHAALDDPDLAEVLAQHCGSSRVRGIRQIVNWHRDPARSYTARDLTRDPAWARGFALLGKFGLSFDLQAYPDQFAAMVPIIAANPATPVIVNHLGMPIMPDGFAPWRAAMQRLAAFPNVSVKLSGVGFIARGWTCALIRPFVLEAIDLFGPPRMMVASDIPTDKLFGSVDRHLEAYAAILGPLSDSERRDIWGRNANRVYRLGLDLR